MFGTIDHVRFVREFFTSGRALVAGIGTGVANVAAKWPLACGQLSCDRTNVAAVIAQAQSFCVRRCAFDDSTSTVFEAGRTRSRAGHARVGTLIEDADHRVPVSVPVSVVVVLLSDRFACTNKCDATGSQ